MRVWKNNYLCFNAGYTLEDILFTVIGAMKFQDCYWTLVKDLEDWTHYNDPAYTFPEDCSSSNDEDITFYTWNPITTNTETYWVGAATFTGCWPGLLFAPEENPVGKQLYDIAFDSFTATYGPEAGRDQK